MVLITSIYIVGFLLLAALIIWVNGFERREQEREQKIWGEYRQSHKSSTKPTVPPNELRSGGGRLTRLSCGCDLCESKDKD